jgi:hypothetical protein
MPRKLTKSDDSEQSKRFIETAEEVEADDEQALERAFKRIGPNSTPADNDPAPRPSKRRA